MSVIFNQPDGLYLSMQATLAQFVEDEALAAFADGMVRAALTEICPQYPTLCQLSLAEALHYTGGLEINPLLTVLLALDAEAQTLVGGERRVLPLVGFLNYRAKLPPERALLEWLRLPPLNPGRHYTFVSFDEGVFLAVRLDLNPELNVAGHVRISASSPSRAPERLLSIEQRLEFQIIHKDLIKTAIAAGSAGLTTPLTPLEQVKLAKAFEIAKAP